MPFRVVSGVDPCIGVLDGSLHVPRGRGFVAVCRPHWFQWRICLTEMYLTRA